MEIKEVLNVYHKSLLRKRNVNGAGIGYKYIGDKCTNEIAIVVFVEQKLPISSLSEGDIIPAMIGGYKTDVREKKFVAFTSPEEKQKKWRPAKGGVSIGHVNITAGTFGCLVKRDIKDHILSNNHVLANSNDAKKGDSILQPGKYDGGTECIAYLEDFVPIVFEQSSSCPVTGLLCKLYNSIAKLFGAKTRLTMINTTTNLVDAAIAAPISPEMVSAEIIDIGTPVGITDPTLGMSVMKSGRTTCLTHGKVDTVDLTIKVSYGTGKTALFVNQIGIQPDEGKFSAGGDSGSAILDTKKQLVGLLYAGDDSGYTIANRISDVFDALTITL